MKIPDSVADLRRREEVGALADSLRLVPALGEGCGGGTVAWDKVDNICADNVRHSTNRKDVSGTPGVRGTGVSGRTVQ